MSRFISLRLSVSLFLSLLSLQLPALYRSSPMHFRSWKEAAFCSIASYPQCPLFLSFSHSSITPPAHVLPCPSLLVMLVWLLSLFFFFLGPLLPSLTAVEETIEDSHLSLSPYSDLPTHLSVYGISVPQHGTWRSGKPL